jgi:hypothetical protein
MNDYTRQTDHCRVFFISGAPPCTAAIKSNDHPIVIYGPVFPIGPKFEKYYI